MPDTRQKRIENEKLVKRENDRTKKLVARVLTIEGQTFLPVRFVCECSDPECSQLIELSIEEFNLVHQYQNRFFVSPGHEHTDIETVVERNEAYYVVEKPAVPSG